MKNLWKSLAGLMVLLVGLTLVVGCSDGTTDEVQKIDQTYSTDIVVVGGGGAGFSAALSAKLAGKEVILLEQLAYTGGNSVNAGGAMNAADVDANSTAPLPPTLTTMSATQKELVEAKIAMNAGDPSYSHLNITNASTINAAMKPWQDALKAHWDKWNAAGSSGWFDSPYLHLLQTYEGGDFIAKPELVEKYATNVVDAWKWLGEQGGTISLTDPPNMLVGSLWYRSHTVSFDGTIVDGGATGPGAGFIRPQERKFVDLGGQRLVEHQAKKIVMDGGKAVGIIGVFPGGVFEVKAKAVIMATGGFGGNWDMLEEYQPNKMANYNPHEQELKWKDIKNYSTTNSISAATGEGMRMAKAAGANLYQMDQIQLLPGSNTGPGVQLADTLYINELGNRIVNEGGRRDELSLSYIAQKNRDPVAGSSWAISSHDGFVLGGTAEGPFATSAAVGTKIYELSGSKADQTAFVTTFVANFDKAVQNYNDSFDGKEADWAGKLNKNEKLQAPWYFGGVIAPYIHHTMGGIEINVNTEVLSPSGAVIPGLYAAGECTGGLHGSNRIGGNAVGDIVVFGREAGKNAAAYIK